MNTNKLQAIGVIDESTLHYQIRYSAEDALQVVSSCGGRFGTWVQRSDLVGFVESVNDLIPPMQLWEGNPNNGKPHHTFSIGREYSRVVYVRIVKTYIRSSFDLDTLVNGLQKLGEEAGADEIHVSRQRGVVSIRFWWD